MANRLAQFLMTKLGRAVFILSSTVLFCISILILESFADSRQVSAFDCSTKIHAMTANDNIVINTPQISIHLSLTFNDEKIYLDYFSEQPESSREHLSLKGQLRELEIGKLLYQLDLDITDAKFISDNSSFQSYLANEFNESKENLAVGNQVSVNVQVLEMDADNGFILVKFTPFSTLWACQLHE
ncbi:hypothetical protein L2737_14780 [Shewanella electrodiphila]|uniref:Uncharacterized protein n=1 Tax=Shewanella electrodiphila TaxID=934143 RepID=A0ABT0KRU2_9GAMM|nr:hypothetical protein [Shewanella electrodiphila]MCL1046575.1 hypothetical protein [Shewanella electrodiphila]